MIEIINGNPLTFYDPHKEDFRRYYPNQYISNHMTYTPGIRSVKYCQKFVIGMGLRFQLRSNTAATVTLHNIVTGSEEVLTSYSVTPPLWTLENIWEWNKTLSIEGEYYCSAVLGDVKLISEPFFVSYQNRNCVRLSISNDKNIVDKGLIFTEDNLTFRSFELLIDGRADLFANAIELETFGTDDGGLSNQNSVTLEIRTLELGAMPAYMWRKLSYLLGMKYVKINGEYWQLKEWETPERVAESNMYTGSLSFQLIDDNSNKIEVEKSVVTGDGVVIGSEDDIIITDK